jgi:hypothetical protein
VALLAGIGVGISSSVIPYVTDQLAMARLPCATDALTISLLPAVATVIAIVVLAQPDCDRGCRGAPGGGWGGPSLPAGRASGTLAGRWRRVRGPAPEQGSYFRLLGARAR